MNIKLKHSIRRAVENVYLGESQLAAAENKMADLRHFQIW